MIKRPWGDDQVYISQTRFNEYSHKGLNAVDIVCSGQGWFLAPCDLSVVAVLPIAKGFANTVMFYDNQNHVTLAMTHTLEIGRYSVGQKIKKGQPLYRQGNASVTPQYKVGTHIHLEIGAGYQTNKYKDANGNWCLFHLINVEDYFYITNEVKIIDSKGIIFEKEGEEMSGKLIKIKYDPEYDYIWTVDGNKYGQSYDVTTENGFADKDLVKQGYEEILAINGSLFYTYEGKHYAEGVEKSRGINNQELGLSCVTKFDDCMAVGFKYDGTIEFAKQKDIISGLSDYYGALTGAFAIMKGGVPCLWGQSEHRTQYEVRSGRTVLGYNSDAGEYLVYTLSGVTAEGGLMGSEMFDACRSMGFTDAIAFDGGGSVFCRYEGHYINSTSRKVKNAILLYRKKKEKKEASNEELERLRKENAELKADISELERTAQGLRDMLMLIKDIVG